MNIKTIILTFILSLTLTSCTDSLTLSEGGMTGTGISTGRITGFGSIYLNGIHYDVDQASFYRDGEIASGQTSYRIGEYITITSNTTNGSINGVATTVTFNSLIRGEITAASTDNQTIEIMGQTIHTDELTVLHGVEQLSELQLGDHVELSGLSNDSDIITASSITLLTSNNQTTNKALKLEGIISNLSLEQQTFDLQHLTIDYSLINKDGLVGESLSNGLRVSVKTKQAVNNYRVIASNLKFSSHHHYSQNTQLELEGIITAINSADQLTLNGQTVSITDTTRFYGVTLNTLSLGITIEAEGIVDATGILVASKIVVRKIRDDRHLKLSGQISALDNTTSSLTLNRNDTDYQLIIDSSSMIIGGRDDNKHRTPTTFDQLSVGDYVEIEAIKQDDNTLRVLRMDLGGRYHPTQFRTPVLQHRGNLLTKGVNFE